MTKPILVFAFGNVSRGDDGLGPELIETLMADDNVDVTQVDFLTDFQLQIEHALDLENRQLVLFVDASVSGKAPVQLHRLQAEQDQSYSTHAMSPKAVLQVYSSITRRSPPSSFLLTIRGYRFQLGEALSVPAMENLQYARDFALHMLQRPILSEWMELAEHA